MINKNLNLQLKLNKSLTNIQDTGPYTPLDQTLKTPIDAPVNYPLGMGYHSQYSQLNPLHPLGQQQQSQQQGQQMGQQAPQGQQMGQQQQGIYLNDTYSESDDILIDTDDSSKLAKNYTLNFTSQFDNLIMSIYSHILSLPTTTPFSGTIPPSGLVSKVANETMNNLITSVVTANVQPVYDQHHIINKDMLGNNGYHPIFLQLIRKRLIEICSNKNTLNKLPLSTAISVSGVPQPQNNPYGTNVRQSSISNLSLTELNINNYQEQQKTRNPSMNLRKQSLTRNNSYSNGTGNGNNWLHIGNLNNIKHPNESTDSLQDFVPQPFINKSASHAPITTPTNPSFGFNNMMMDYQTPPSSNKSSFSTPPQSVQIVHNPVLNSSEYDDFNFGQQRSRSSSSLSFPRPLTINTDNANLQALNSLNGNGETLDSPFMSANEEPLNGFNGFSLIPESVENQEKILPTKINLSEKKRDSLKMKRGIL